MLIFEILHELHVTNTPFLFLKTCFLGRINQCLFKEDCLVACWYCIGDPYEYGASSPWFAYVSIMHRRISL